MTFLNPLVLLGLAAASIPVILHLLNLRKLKQIDFSTLRFLKELQKTRLRRIKIKRILLLILRTLIIVFAVLAFARPTVQSSLPLLGSYAKTSAVILVDNSFSMDVSDEYGNRLNQAKSAAMQIINAMKDGDEAAVLPMTASQERPAFKLTRNFQELGTELSLLKVAAVPANLEHSIHGALSLLEESININKEIYVISDCQENVFFRELSDSLRRQAPAAVIYFVPIGISARAGLRNLSIDSLAVISRIFQKDKLVEVEARVRNSSEKEATGVVVSLVFNNERVAERSVDLAANETKSVTIAAPASSYGVTSAYVEIEGDALAEDNRRWFGFIIPEKPTVALIGKPDAARFVTFAIDAPGKAIASPAKVDAFKPEEFAGINLSNYDIVILAGGPLREGDFERLERWTRQGGSALIFADDESNPGTFAAAMARLGLGNISIVDFSKQQPGAFTSVDKTHPIFEGVFKGSTDSRSVVESPKIYRAALATGGAAIIEAPGGAFMSEARPGEGRVIYIGSALSLSWSTLPFTGIFPTIIYRSVGYLSSSRSFSEAARPDVPLSISLPAKYSAGGNFRISDPEGNDFYAEAVQLPGGAVLKLDNLAETGNYIIYSPDNKPFATVPVNFDATESIIKPVNADELEKKIYSALGDEVKMSIISDTRDLEKSVVRARTGSELWQIFLILALACAVAEMFVEKNSKLETEGA